MEVHVASYVKVESAGVPGKDNVTATADADANAEREKTKLFAWTPDSAVIVHSQGGRLGVIGWGANCFCLTKISQINGTPNMSLK